MEELTAETKTTTTSFVALGFDELLINIRAQSLSERNTNSIPSSGEITFEIDGRRTLLIRGINSESITLRSDWCLVLSLVS